ncbi:hypothetical protein NN4_24330 [Nocardia ninae NBRC 108245]|uniref:Uncharacterized protein n=1 Tax=Nocardia ninae NBRC 108245 TaxID=1210091 RepID=A0A511MB74_9NOCA|nr:hypothetical protein NN4_24330 [Nocardia ninae NBRC 108245]
MQGGKVEGQRSLQGGFAFRGEADGAAGADSGDPVEFVEAAAEVGACGAAQVGAAFGPVEAGAGEGAAGGVQGGGVDAERAGQPGETGFGEGETVVLIEEGLGGHGIGDGDAQASGQVVVAGATVCQSCCGSGGSEIGHRRTGWVQVGDHGLQ